MRFVLFATWLVGFAVPLACGQDVEHPTVVHVAEFPRVFRGTITNNEGEPVEGALLSWGPRSAYTPEPVYEAVQTNAQGEYEIVTRHVGGDFSLRVSAPGYASTWQHELIPGPASAPTQLDFKLANDRPLEITLVDENGKGIEGLGILPFTPSVGFYSSFSMPTEPERVPGHAEPTVTNSQGKCILSQLIPGPSPLKKLEEEQQLEQSNHNRWLLLKISHGSTSVHEHQVTRIEYHASKGQLTVVVPNDRNLNLEREPNGVLHLMVVDEVGEPLPDFQVTLRHRPQPWNARNAVGRLQIEQLDPECAYEVRVFASGYAPYTRRVTPSETSEASPCEIRLQKHPALEVRLVNAVTGAPISDLTAVCGVYSQQGRPYVDWGDYERYADGLHAMQNVCRMTSTAQGRLSVPEGEQPMTLFLLKPGYGRRVIPPEQRPQADADGVIIIPMQPEARVHGKLVAGAQLAALANYVSLYFKSHDGFDHMNHQINFDEQGEFTLEALDPGEYHFTLMHTESNSSSSCWSRKVLLTAGQHLELPLGELPGTLTFAGRTSPFTRIALSTRVEADYNHLAVISDIDGYFRIEKLLPSHYQIQLGDQAPWRRNMQLVLDQKQGPVEIDLQQHTFIDYSLPAAAVPVDATAQ